MPWLLCALFSLIMPASALAQTGSAYAETVTVCHAAGSEIPDFSSPGCTTKPYWRVDPQGREIWVKASVKTPPALMESGQPAGLFVSAKAASEVYLNGRYLGANGRPAASRAAETPGRMDAVFYAPPETLGEEENEILIRMSSHHGFMKFRYPVHWIALGAYHDPTTRILQGYWPSLVPFGVLIAGALYFAASSLGAGRKINLILLSLVSLAAAAQLVTEVYRGLTPYLYPAHEWRMLLIVFFSLIFGLSLAAHVMAKFLSRRLLWFVAAAAATVTSTFFASGYDGKAALAVLTPTGLSALVAFVAARRREPQALVYGAALLLFGGGIVAFPTRFLDVIFFYETAALVLFLFVTQAIAFQKERELRATETSRARQLQTALDQARQAETPTQIKISSAGKIDLVPADDIAHCKGAGDYVEITLKDGREFLHNGSLAELETELPAAFLRVHRSYLVNTNLVQSLKRESSGVGALKLSSGAVIPVSRRILPKVRSALQ